MPKAGDHFYIDGRGVKAEGMSLRNPNPDDCCNLRLTHE